MMNDDIIRLLVIEESANDAEVILSSLRKARYPIRPRHIEDEDDLEGALSEQWDLLISVPRVGDFTAEAACEIVNNAHQDIPMLVLSNSLDGKTVASLLNAGIRQVLPAGNDACLQVAVGKELRDLQARRRYRYLEQMYKESQRQNKLLLQSSRDAIAYVHDGMHVYTNPTYLKMFGYKDMEDMEGLPIMDLVSINEQTKFKEFMREFIKDENREDSTIELIGLRSDNKRFPLRIELGRAMYEGELCVQVVIRDRSQDEKAKELGRRDPLTSLYNRSYFITILEKTLSKSIESNSRYIVFYVSLDSFDSSQQHTGVSIADPVMDPVIHNIASILQNCCKSLGDGVTIARFGDSVFTLLLMDKDINYSSALAAKICKTIESSVTELKDHSSIITTCSIGIAPVFASTTSPQDVLSDAHTACMIVTKRGGNGFEVYKAVAKSQDDNEVSKLQNIAKIIETAKDEKRLSLLFQPIVSLKGENQEIYEVFLKVVDNDGERISSADVFRAAEQNNMTNVLDKWVLENALRLLSKRRQQGFETIFFVKISDQSVRDGDMLLYLRKLIKASGVVGEAIVIELSDAIALSQVKIARTFVESLKKMGCSTALEHFGTGLAGSSTITLKHIPADYVKIDRSFIKILATSQESQAKVKEIVSLAKELNKLTVAEAVEDPNSLAILWQEGVDYSQGHYIQEPIEDLTFKFSDEDS
jgi:diguanylate cyclase (GGDEF)-like protein/PAS domain S-box-containing protein